MDIWKEWKLWQYLFSFFMAFTNILLTETHILLHWWSNVTAKIKEIVRSGALSIQSGLNVRKFTVKDGMEQHFLQKKRGQSCIPLFSKISYQELPSHLTFLLELPKFLVEWFVFWNTTIFRFLPTIPEHFFTICRRLKFFEMFGWMESVWILWCIWSSPHKYS